VSIDIRTLPSLVPPDLLNITARAVVPVIEDNITKLKTLLASNDLASEPNPTPPESTCQFAVYAQVHPSNVSAAKMRELENELMHPTGVTTIWRPPLQLDLALVSPECGVLIEVKDADGMRSRIFFRKVTSCTSMPTSYSLSTDLLQTLDSLGSFTLQCSCCSRTKCQRVELLLLSPEFLAGRSLYRR
jgi:transmembrane E3 ubiquitin-protein ligase